jgi:hypothetical protein
MLMVLATSLPARALTITPISDPVLIGNQNSQEALTGILDDYFAGLGLNVDLLYKSDQGGSDSGPAASWYNTEYFNTPADPQEAVITWQSGSPFIANSSPIYLLVKDGRHVPAWYLFNISGWNGTEEIRLDNFWAQSGAISNVGIYGGATAVPDGGSMAMLLGMALLALAGSRRLLA